MRFLPLLLLLGCYDAATTTITLDTRAGVATVHQRLHNAWPDEVGCANLPDTAVEACVAAIDGFLAATRTSLEEKGAIGVSSGIVLAEGELDLVYRYTAPVGSDALNDHGLSVVYVEERTGAQAKRGRPGKRSVALLTTSGTGGTRTETIEGRYRTLSMRVSGDPVALHVFHGREATVRSEWVYTPGEGDRPSPGAWLRDWPGLEDALRTSGLVVSD